MISGPIHAKYGSVLFLQSQTTMNLHKLLVVLVLLFIISVNDSFGQGNLILLQKRLVFSANDKDDMQIVDFGNIGKEAAEYEVSLINLRMTTQGGFETITVPDSGQYFADKNIRFFPRRIVIAPSGSQTMKVQLYDAENLAPGEYRSHLYFRARNDAGVSEKETIAGTAPANGTTPASETTPAEEKKPATDVSISIRTEFGIAIPVIIRKGESTTVVSLTNLNLVQKEGATPQLQFTIERSGNFSSYGHINVTHVSPDGVETPVGGVMGVAVYTPLQARNCLLNLDISGSTSNSGNTQNTSDTQISDGLKNSSGSQTSGTSQSSTGTQTSSTHKISSSTMLSGGYLKVEYVQPKEEGGAVLANAQIQL